MLYRIILGIIILTVGLVGSFSYFKPHQDINVGAAYYDPQTGINYKTKAGTLILGCDSYVNNYCELQGSSPVLQSKDTIKDVQ